VTSGGNQYVFRLKEGNSFNFSRTIGIIGEFFNVCFHANGYTIVVRSREVPVAGRVSEMGGFEIRNFLLPGEMTVEEKKPPGHPAA